MSDKPENLEITFEGQKTTIGKLSKKQSIRLIAGLLKEKQIVRASITNLVDYAGLVKKE